MGVEICVGFGFGPAPAERWAGGERLPHSAPQGAGGLANNDDARAARHARDVESPAQVGAAADRDESEAGSASGGAEAPPTVRVLGRDVPVFWACALFAVGVVFGQTGQSVTLPIFSDDIAEARSTPYFVVWFAAVSFVVYFGAILVVMYFTTDMLGEREWAMLSIKGQAGPLFIGLSDAANSMMIVFAAPSSRTAPFLQAILSNVMIPLTVVIRAGLLRKVPTPWQGLAAAIVLGGCFLCVLPTIAKWDQSDSQKQSSIFWPTWFCLGFIPASFMNVIEEKVLKQSGAMCNTIWFVFWLNFWQLFFVSMMFWLDLIPQYGVSEGMDAWGESMKNGFACFWGMELHCGNRGFGWGMAFIGLSMLRDVSGAFLLRSSEGAMWQAIIMSIVTPLGALWWTLFQQSPHFHYDAQWSKDSTYSVIGVAFMLPGIFLYKMSGPARDPVLEEDKVVEPLLPEADDIITS